MTKEEIMKMDDRSLYLRILLFFFNHESYFAEVKADNCAKGFEGEPSSKALLLCYQAEEKIKEMGWKVWIIYETKLTNIIESIIQKESFIFDLIHAHPRDRARAILMTIGESHDRT